MQARRARQSGVARRRRAACALALLAAVAAIAAAAPGGAVADQASQPTSPAAGRLGTGNFHSCAVHAGALRCWGYGGDGALGYANTVSIGDDETPESAGTVQLGAGRTVTAMSAGSVHTCALLDNGTVRCWGFGANGRLGYGSTDAIGDNEAPFTPGPVDLGTESGVPLTATAIAAGDGHSCAILVNGALRCWGFNLDGRLGLGHTNPIGDNETPGSIAPIDLGAGRTAKAVAAGVFHTCAILDDDTVRCWGFGGAGRLGYANIRSIGREPARTGDPNSTDPALQPVDSIVTAGPVFLGEENGLPLKARAITAGYGHTCAILSNGSVRCWGFNGNGQLGYPDVLSVGDDETPGMLPPVDLGPGRTAKAIDAGREQTCAVLDNDTVRCWGWAAFGQLGYGNISIIGDTETPGSVGPVDIGTGRTAAAISAGALHTCVTLDDESVRCWGYGANGRLGYCAEETIGDDEKAGSAGPVALAQPAIAADGCPVSAPPPPPPPPPPGPVPPPPPPPPVPPVDRLAAALAAERERLADMRGCLRTARTRLRSDRRRAAALRGARRRVALRTAAVVAGQRRSTCMRRFGRVPGAVTRLAARASGRGRIRLSFRAPGTDGAQPPAARGYIIKQSDRPIRTARDFARAPALCGGKCSFRITAVGASVALTITDLPSRRRLYFAVAARDNVSGRTGPRATVAARPG